MKYHVHVDKSVSPLSGKENEVLSLLGEGLSRPEMSKHLERSLATINTHLAHIFQKLDADNEKQAIVIGMLKGILSFKNFMVCWLAISSISGLMLPGQAYAGEEGDDHPTERVSRRGGRGGLKINRVFGRKGSSRRREDSGLELWLDEE